MSELNEPDPAAAAEGEAEPGEAAAETPAAAEDGGGEQEAAV